MATITKEIVEMDGKKFIRITSQQERPPQPEPTITLHSIEKLEGAIADLDSKIANEQAEITTHEANIAELNARKASIQADVDSLKN